MAWKFNYVQNSLLEKVVSLTEKKKKGHSFSVKTWERSSTIVPVFIGLRFRVYNGKSFFPISVTQEMVGYKFGEFVPTRARYEFKKKKKKK